MNTTGKEGYWPIVQGLRLGPNDGEEPNDSVSMVRATVGEVDNALTLPESNRVPNTKTSPVQWNQMGNSRGVPSRPV